MTVKQFDPTVSPPLSLLKLQQVRLQFFPIFRYFLFRGISRWDFYKYFFGWSEFPPLIFPVFRLRPALFGNFCHGSSFYFPLNSFFCWSRFSLSACALQVDNFQLLRIEIVFRWKSATFDFHSSFFGLSVLFFCSFFSIFPVLQNNFTGGNNQDRNRAFSSWIYKKICSNQPIHKSNFSWGETIN